MSHVHTFCLLTTLIFMSAAMVGCDVLNSIFGGRNESTGEMVQVREGEQVELEPFGAELRFEEVVNESRCPAGAQCPWAGRAVIGVSFLRESKPPVDLQLVIPGLVDVDSDDGYAPVDTLGYRFTLRALEPYPTVDVLDRETNAVATIRVEQL